MPGAGDLLAARSSVGLALFFVTWVAIVLLTLIVVHLHLRLQLLERRSAPASRKDAYAHLQGRRVEDLLGVPSNSWQPRFVLFVSAPCPSCTKVLDELRAPGWPAPTAVVWTNAHGAPPSSSTGLPPNVRTLDEGPRISAALGIEATPFLLIVGDDGVVQHGTPVNSLEPLRRAAAEPARAPRTAELHQPFKEVTP